MIIMRSTSRDLEDVSSDEESVGPLISKVVPERRLPTAPCPNPLVPQQLLLRGSFFTLPLTLVTPPKPLNEHTHREGHVPEKLIMWCAIVGLPLAGRVAQKLRRCAVLGMTVTFVLRNMISEALVGYQYYGSGCQYQGSIPCRFTL